MAAESFTSLSHTELVAYHERESVKMRLTVNQLKVLMKRIIFVLIRYERHGRKPPGNGLICTLTNHSPDHIYMEYETLKGTLAAFLEYARLKYGLLVTLRRRLNYMPGLQSDEQIFRSPLMIADFRSHYSRVHQPADVIMDIPEVHVIEISNDEDIPSDIQRARPRHLPDANNRSNNELVPTNDSDFPGLNQESELDVIEISDEDAHDDMSV